MPDSVMEEERPEQSGGQHMDGYPKWTNPWDLQYPTQPQGKSKQKNRGETLEASINPSAPTRGRSLGPKILTPAAYSNQPHVDFVVERPNTSRTSQQQASENIQPTTGPSSSLQAIPYVSPDTVKSPELITFKIIARYPAQLPWERDYTVHKVLRTTTLAEIMGEHFRETLPLRMWRDIGIGRLLVAKKNEDGCVRNYRCGTGRTYEECRSSGVTVKQTGWRIHGDEEVLLVCADDYTLGEYIWLN